MTDHTPNGEAPAPAGAPAGGLPAEAGSPEAQAPAESGWDEAAAEASADAPDHHTGPADAEASEAPNVQADAALAAERLLDLQRLQAEYVNYKRRVDRDRALVQERAVADVLETLFPVLDDIHAARQHGDLESGPFAAIAEKLETILARFGLERFGAPGEAFDPMVHEALMHVEAELAEGTTSTTVVQVLQPGYRTGERVLRPARVSVADPS